MGSLCTKPTEDEDDANSPYVGVTRRNGSGRISETKDDATLDILFACKVAGYHHDQDRFVLWPSLLPGVFYGAIHDGHGPHGEDIATRATDALPTAFRSKLMELSNANSEIQFNSNLLDESLLKRALVDVMRTFQEECDADYEETVMNRVHKLKIDMEESTGEKLDDIPMPLDAGTTSTVCVITGDTLFIGWLGDSRAVLMQQDVQTAGTLCARRLTTDHNVNFITKHPTSPEMSRVKQHEVEFFGKHLIVADADGMLQVTRSLGDVPFHRSGVVSCEPEFCYIPSLKDLNPQFLVVASDGLWDHFTDDEVLQFLVNFFGDSTIDESALVKAVEALIDETGTRSKAKKAKHDDVSVFVLHFTKKSAL